MKQRLAGRPSSSEQIIRDIKRKTRKQYQNKLQGISTSLALLCEEAFDYDLRNRPNVPHLGKLLQLHTGWVYPVQATLVDPWANKQ